MNRPVSLFAASSTRLFAQAFQDPIRTSFKAIHALFFAGGPPPAEVVPPLSTYPPVFAVGDFPSKAA